PVVRSEDARHAAGSDELLELVAVGQDLPNHPGEGTPAASPLKRGFQGLLPGPERLVELGVRDDERDEHADAVAVDARLREQQAALQRLLDHVRGDLAAVELHREHRAEPADVADARPALLPGEHPRADRIADHGRTLDEALLLDHVEDGERRRLRDGVPDVGAAHAARLRGIDELRLAEHAGERDTHRDRLGDRDQVRLHAVVLDREEAAGAREAALYLVADHYDPVLVADGANALEELLRGRHEAAFALDRLDDDC